MGRRILLRVYGVVDRLHSVTLLIDKMDRGGVCMKLKEQCA